MKEIGERFKYENHNLIVKKGLTCSGCYFRLTGHRCAKPIPTRTTDLYCASSLRQDDKDVIFYKLNYFQYGK